MSQVGVANFEPSLVRLALDELLRRYPTFDLVSIDWNVITRPSTWGELVVADSELDQPWALVMLGQPSATFDETPAWAIWKFAIFKATGALHSVGDVHSRYPGAVSDDPLWTP